MNKTILIGVGAVAAFLLYRKFMAKPKVEEEVVEETEEQTEESGGAPSGGGGGGGGAAGPKDQKPTKSAPETTAKPNQAVANCGCKEGQKPCPNKRCAARKKASLSPIGTKAASRPMPMGKPRMMSVKPMRPVQGMSRSMAKPMARPLPASKPMAKFAGFMDFDGFPDVQSNIM